MNINIISNQECDLKLDVSGSYQLSLVGVSGPFNTQLINDEDFLIASYEEKVVTIYFQKYGKLDPTQLEEIINTDFKQYNEKGHILLHYDEMNSKYDFNYPITNCSDRVKFLLGIKLLPTGSQSDQVCSFNNSMYLFIKTEDLSSPMRYSWQTKPNATDRDKYSPVMNIVSVNLNTFYSGNPFNLAGNSYIVDESKLKHIHFRITDIYDNIIIFENDIVWTFILTPYIENSE